MKTRFTFLLVALMHLSIAAVAQSPVSRLAAIVENESQMHEAVTYNLFDMSEQRDILIDREIANVSYLRLNREMLSSLIASKNPLIKISLPLGAGKTLNAVLSGYDIRDDGFKSYERMGDGQKKEITVPAGAFYRGIVSGENSSVAAFTFSDEDIMAVISTPEGGNYNLVRHDSASGKTGDLYLLFREADIRTPATFHCDLGSETERIKDMQKELSAGRNSFTTCAKLRVSMNADYLTFQKKGGAVNATNYLLALFNVIATLYANEDIQIVLSETVINSAADGYTFNSSTDVLKHFGGQVYNTFRGDVAHLITAYNVSGFPPLGGLAWLATLCMPPTMSYHPDLGDVWVGPFAIANNYTLDNIPQIPIYSWDAAASTHEIGHNLGSPHTHSCLWPGGPIDNCAPVDNGPCADGPAPSTAGGTIMSYCHLTPRGTNFTLGFGPLPGDLLRENMATNGCTGTASPLQTLVTAGVSRIANRQCADGNWTYYYYDNNTATDDDDEMIMMIQTNGQDIGNVDDRGFQIKMTTEAGYGSNTGRSVTAPYATATWREAQRSWNITLSTQPASPVLVRFPFTAQDIADIKGSLSTLNQASQLSVVAFNSQAAAANPANAAADAVHYYQHDKVAGASSWRLGALGNYQYAEFSSNYGIFGGSLGFKELENGIRKGIISPEMLAIYPNPTQDHLYIMLPGSSASTNYQLAIYDHLGRQVATAPGFTGGTGQVRLDVGALPIGLYSIRYTDDSNSLSGRFVKL